MAAEHNICESQWTTKRCVKKKKKDVHTLNDEIETIVSFIVSDDTSFNFTLVFLYIFILISDPKKTIISQGQVNSFSVFTYMYICMYASEGMYVSPVIGL